MRAESNCPRCQAPSWREQDDLLVIRVVPRYGRAVTFAGYISINMPDGSVQHHGYSIGAVVGEGGIRDVRHALSGMVMVEYPAKRKPLWRRLYDAL